MPVGCIHKNGHRADRRRPSGGRLIGGPSRSSVGGTPRKEHEMSVNAESAVLAGGCFWIMQQLLRDRDGVISTRVGWIGGENENPTQKNNVGHAEAVEVTFDPDR